MIELKNVTFSYPGQEAPTLKNISLTIEPNQFLAIVGGNGSGKTTLCKLFNGIIPHFFVGDLTGEITITGEDTITSDVANLSKKVGYVYQDFENSIVRPTVFDEVTFSPLNYGLEDYKERGERALQVVGLTHLRNEYVWQLSGGQKHLVALAAVLSLDPDIIIIDEPVAQLDPFHARAMYDLLKKLHEEEGKTIIVIEHHTEFIANYCKEVLLLHEGQIKWMKDVKSALTSLEDLRLCHIYPPQVTQAAFEIDGSEGRHLPINLMEAQNYFEKLDWRYIPELSLTEEHLKEETVKFSSVQGGYIGRKKKKIVLHEVNQRFYEGERVAIVGSNGAGKSTLLRMISGLQKPTKGDVVVLNQQVSRMSPEEVADFVAYIHQNPEEMFIDDSIFGDVSFFLRARKMNDYEQVVEDILQKLNLIHMKEKDGRLMSGGQQRRTSLAIGLGMRPQIMLLDEPTASLDISSRKELLKMLQLLKDQIKTTFIATHDMQLVADWATRVLVLHQGEVIFDGKPEGLFSNKQLLDFAHLVPPQVVELCHALDLPSAQMNIQSFVQGYKVDENRRERCGIAK